MQGRPDPGVEAMLDALDPLELPRLDERSRSWGSGIWWVAEPPTVRRSWWRRLLRRPAPLPPPPRRPPLAPRLAALLGLLSGDGYERERSVRAVELGRAATGLVAIRCADWVPQVRRAALARVQADVAPERLVELLPLLERVASEWSRGGELDRLVDRRLGDADLVAALGSGDPRTRRAAWRRLLERGTTSPELLRRGFADRDARVRLLVTGALPALAPDARRAFAEDLLSDPVGKIAARALDVLVELDGAERIPAALAAPTATVRHRARDWAAVHEVDARAIYLARLERDPDDAIALTALAETADRRDAETIRRAAADPRARVRAAALRALAVVDQGAARTAAVEALLNDPAGRVTRAAAQVLRASPPFDADAERLAEAALDPSRSPRLRMRVVSVLRRFRWLHLALVLDALPGAQGELRSALDGELTVWLRRSSTIGRGPDPQTRAAIEAALPRMDEARRRELEFVLRTV